MDVQGQELEALREATPYQHVVYCGDGANDLCPALALGATDVVLARKVMGPARRIIMSLYWTDHDRLRKETIQCSKAVAATQLMHWRHRLNSHSWVCCHSVCVWVHVCVCVCAVCD